MERGQKSVRDFMLNLQGHSFEKDKMKMSLQLRGWEGNMKDREGP
jgi:hypothetical protein